MRAIFLILSFLLFSLVLSSFGAKAESDLNIKLSVEEYVFKNGKPYPLSRVYEIMSPDSGFLPYYVYVDNKTNSYPFVFNREGIKDTNEPYSRCNLAFAINGRVLIPERKYNSGYAEDTEQCLGVSGSVKTFKKNNNIEWFVTKTIYDDNSDKPDFNYEVYFYSGGRLCFSQKNSVFISVNKGDILRLKNIHVNKDDFAECSKIN